MSAIKIESICNPDWRLPVMTPEDMYAAPAEDGECDCRSAVAIRREAEEAYRAGKPAHELFAAYHKKRAEAQQARDAMRIVNLAAAVDLGKRIGRLVGVVVRAVEVDDFGRAEFQIEVNGTSLWTRPVEVDGASGYRRLRDAIAARRRDDWDRSRLWLSGEAPWRRVVEWDGYEQLRFGENQYGTRWWPR